MSCQICKRGNCTESFHSIAEQEKFEQRVEAILVSQPVVPDPPCPNVRCPGCDNDLYCPCCDVSNR